MSGGGVITYAGLQVSKCSGYVLWHSGHSNTISSAIWAKKSYCLIDRHTDRQDQNYIPHHLWIVKKEYTVRQKKSKSDDFRWRWRDTSAIPIQLSIHLESKNFQLLNHRLTARFAWQAQCLLAVDCYWWTPVLYRHRWTWLADKAYLWTGNSLSAGCQTLPRMVFQQTCPHNIGM